MTWLSRIRSRASRKGSKTQPAPSKLKSAPTSPAATSASAAVVEPSAEVRSASTVPISTLMPAQHETAAAEPSPPAAIAEVPKAEDVFPTAPPAAAVAAPDVPPAADVLMESDATNKQSQSIPNPVGPPTPSETSGTLVSITQPSGEAVQVAADPSKGAAGAAVPITVVSDATPTLDTALQPTPEVDPAKAELAATDYATASTNAMKSEGVSVIAEGDTADAATMKEGGPAAVGDAVPEKAPAAAASVDIITSIQQAQEQESMDALKLKESEKVLAGLKSSGSTSGEAFETAQRNLRLAASAHEVARTHLEVLQAEQSRLSSASQVAKAHDNDLKNLYSGIQDVVVQMEQVRAESEVKGKEARRVEEEQRLLAEHNEAVVEQVDTELPGVKAQEANTRALETAIMEMRAKEAEVAELNLKRLTLQKDVTHADAHVPVWSELLAEALAVREKTDPDTHVDDLIQVNAKVIAFETKIKRAEGKAQKSKEALDQLQPVLDKKEAELSECKAAVASAQDVCSKDAISRESKLTQIVQAATGSSTVAKAAAPAPAATAPLESAPASEPVTAPLSSHTAPVPALELAKDSADLASQPEAEQVDARVELAVPAGKNGSKERNSMSSKLKHIFRRP